MIFLYIFVYKYLIYIWYVKISMWKRKNTFKRQTIWTLPNYTKRSIVQSFFSVQGVIKLFIIACSLYFVFLVGKVLIYATGIVIEQIAKWWMHILSESIGDEMIKDEFGHINVMIVGYGWEHHAGWYLADSIMVASYNPKIWALTMLSIPRDLFVSDPETKIIWRINALFARNVRKYNDIGSGARILAKKLEEITWIPLYYYAIIDFWWFKNVIDTLWWITIDIPYTLHDTLYPDNNNWYMTIHFDSWVQILDWEKALQYVRSRHSTSDFSRSKRQQLIIQAIVDTMKQKWIRYNIKKFKTLYEIYNDMVHTNITDKEIIGGFKYLNALKYIFSFTYTTECSHKTYRYSFPGCFLYTPDSSLFDWAAVIIPYGGTPGNFSFYNYTKKFASYVIYHQWYLIENPRITILNGIDKSYAKKVLKKSEWFANQLAVKLNKYAYNVVKVDNFWQILWQTTVYMIWTWEYTKTLETLKTFFPIPNYQEPSEEIKQQRSGVDMLIVLGNDYIDRMSTTPFNYYQ